MTYGLMTDILDELNDSLDIPYSYYQFEDRSEIEGKDCYISYFEDEKLKFLADNKVYHYEPHFAVELYTRRKDLAVENALIALFDANDIPWGGGDTVYIDDEKMYQTVFYC